MKLFYDQELTKEVPPDSVIDWGVVPAGETRDYTFYLHNDTAGYVLNLEVALDHPELFVLQAPAELASFETKELRIQWQCSVDLKQGLKAPLGIAFNVRYS